MRTRVIERSSSWTEEEITQICKWLSDFFDVEFSEDMPVSPSIEESSDDYFSEEVYYLIKKIENMDFSDPEYYDTILDLIEADRRSDERFFVKYPR